jgi:hypothetical protein
MRDRHVKRGARSRAAPLLSGRADPATMRGANDGRYQAAS